LFCIFIVEMLSKEEEIQYSRHLLLEKVGVKGQLALKNARVVVIGAGGLGIPVIQYLSAAGVGTIGIVDGDTIEQSNLQRQVWYTHQDIGTSKANCLAQKIKKLNPYIQVEVHQTYIKENNIEALLTPYDIVLDGCDNFNTRYLVNDSCVALKKPLVYGSIHKFEGQLSVFNAYISGKRSAHLRHLFPQAPPTHLVPDCSTVGVIGALPGIIGSMMALETIKLITNIGQPLIERLLCFNGISMQSTLLEYSTFSLEYSTEINPLEIDIKEYKKLQKVQLIDVRSQEEYLKQNVGAQHIPLEKIEHCLDQFLIEKQIVLHCASGIRSLKAAEILQKKGIKAKSLKGGIKSLLT